MTAPARTKSIVAGIDGSKAAIRAALWAVDEAVSRDVPLRLLYATELADGRETAELAVRQAVTAIRAAGRPLTVETEVVHGPAVASLVRSSASAAMVCVGAVGLRHFQPGRVGSTAAALAISARCPVAIIRGRDDPRRQPAGKTLVEIAGSLDPALLGAAIEEALLRGAALQAVVSRRTGPAERGDAEADRRALADLDRRLTQWKRRHPQLRVESVAIHVGLLEYLAGPRGRVSLVIVGAHNRAHVAELVGPVGSSVMQDADCSLLIVNRRHL
ncbi:universal stress protein [Mycobacterium sp. SMC-2]|uniref:universal stress protein n=1 Tax=Mycobacterium sp. SMC-2 TaxID=2857058 RepID=UPI0021B186BF|nr:universal stress protein [Mycobacterium sp. SMC-2]UXA08361.1 universal stress protein [Mycobacterium sp. SMC-2]